MDFLPSVVQAKYEGDYRIYLKFNDATEGTLDLADWLDGEVFEPLKDPAYFGRFFIEAGTIGWPNGADIAPETLYRRLKASQAA